MSLSFDDSSGKLRVEAKVTWWALGDHDKKVSQDVEILPPFVYGLVAQGRAFPAILNEAAAILSVGLNDKTFGNIKSALERAAAKVNLGFAQDISFIAHSGDLMDRLVHAAPDQATCIQIASVPVSTLMDALHAVVHDTGVQAQYPGIAEKIVFPAGHKPPARVHKDGPPGIGLLAAIAGGIAAIVFGILAALLALAAAAVPLALVVWAVIESGDFSA